MIGAVGSVDEPAPHHGPEVHVDVNNTGKQGGKGQGHNQNRGAADRRQRDVGPNGRVEGFTSGNGVVDPRIGLDRRVHKGGASEAGAADEFRTLSGLERRRGAGRRRSDFTRSAEEGELTPEQFLFVKAIDEFKKANNKMFPSWTDVLEVIRLLGYRKTMASELNIRAAEDWKEKPDTAANVRPMGWERRFEGEEQGERRDAA